MGIQHGNIWQDPRTIKMTHMSNGSVRSFVLRSFPPSHFILLSCICYLQASSSSLVHSKVFTKLLRIGKRALTCLVDGHLKIAGLVVFAPKVNHVYQSVDKINYGIRQIPVKHFKTKTKGEIGIDYKKS